MTTTKFKVSILVLVATLFIFKSFAATFATNANGDIELVLGPVDYDMRSVLETNPLPAQLTCVGWITNTVAGKNASTVINGLKYFGGTLKGNNNWLAILAAWVATLRVVFKPFNVWLQKRLSSTFMNSVAVPGSDHDLFLQRILTSKKYRTVAFVLDLVASLKLPDIDSYIAHLVATFPTKSLLRPAPQTVDEGNIGKTVSEIQPSGAIISRPAPIEPAPAITSTEEAKQHALAP